MRAAIFLGLIFIAKSIRDDCFSYGNLSSFVGLFFAIFFIMDLVELIDKLKNK